MRWVRLQSFLGRSPTRSRGMSSHRLVLQSSKGTPTRGLFAEEGIKPADSQWLIWPSPQLCGHSDALDLHGDTFG